MTEEKGEDICMSVARPMLFNAAMEWCNAGDKRSVAIESHMSTVSGAFEARNQIWIYDHDLQIGKHINHIDQFPSQKSLKSMKIAELQKEIRILSGGK